MVRLAGDLGLTEDDMNLIYSKYERNGAFNYYAFCKDMDRPSSPIKFRGDETLLDAPRLKQWAEGGNRTPLDFSGNRTPLDLM
mmetsp:Transcript_24528/g.80386  ORF Transcript_24528/g.80386 Transcript_24528/m.80386 type:complete len:83 (+) Transcript_24528:936-1184(+)